MRIHDVAVISILTATLAVAGCAVSPEAEQERLQREEAISLILAQPLDPEEFGEPKRCLNDNEYRSYRALDARRIVFEGRSDRYWINTLRSNCSDLRWGDVLVVESFSTRRICNNDHFAVADWFEWPWYRRWPWHWGRSFGSGMQCTFGMFQPVTADQIGEIEAVLDQGR